MKAALAQIQNEGFIGNIETVDATQEPERAQALNIKSVPWLRLGTLEFDGQMSPGDLRAWARTADTDQGLRHYFFTMLKNGKRAHVESVIRQHPQYALTLGELVNDADASMAVRIGIGAVLEELGASADAMVPALVKLLNDIETRNRADAAHFLSLIATPAALSALRPALNDSSAEVREIAAEALDHHHAS